MTPTRRAPGILWRLVRRLNPLLGRGYSRNARMHSFVLLLTTKGRKSGLPRVTPLQYEDVDGVIYIASARGAQADWVRNIRADPHVTVQIGARTFEAIAEPILDAPRIADFLELRLARHPKMIGALLRAEGLPRRHTRHDLEQFSQGKAVVALRPAQPGDPAPRR